MPFDTGLFFAVAFNDGTNNRLIAKQTRLGRVTLNPGSIAASWTNNAVRLYDGTGTEIAVTPPTNLFHVVKTSSGAGGDSGTIDLDLNELAGATVDVKTAFFTALLNGGKAEIDVQADTQQTLTIQLRALKTGTFTLNANVAERAFRPGVSGNNLAVGTGDVLGNYTYQMSQSYDASGTATGPYTQSLTASAAGDLTIPAAASAPSDAATQTMLLKISHSGTGKTSFLPINIMVPTDFILLLDRSGSMSATVTAGLTKWDAARQVSNLFSDLYADVVDDLTTGQASIVDKNQIRIGRFEFTGSFVLDWVPSGGFATGSAKPHVPSADVPGTCTPIGEALMAAASTFTGSKWKRRAILLCSDGMDNLHSPGAPSLAEIIAGTAGFPDTPTDDVTNGVAVHVISYALSGETPIAGFAALAGSHEGQFHDAAPDTDPLASDNLRAMFLNVLESILPVERLGPSASISVPVEEGLSRCTFIATRTGTLSLSTPGSGAGGTTSTGASSSIDGLQVVSVDDPEPGTWAGTVPAGADLYALYDLALRMRCGAQSEGIGRPIKLFAEISMWGEPVSGADVRVGSRFPLESVGELLTKFAQSGGIGKAIQRGQLPSSVLVASTAAPGHDLTAAARTVDTRALQAQLLRAAEAGRNLSVQHGGSSVTLTEVRPGRYEATVQATQNENSYNFYFRADGFTPLGCAFARDYRLTVVLSPVPTPEQSASTLVQVASAGGKATWQATVFPKTAANKPVGPGLANVFLTFDYADPADRKKYPKLDIVDHLDGTYSTTMVLPQGDAVPSIGLFGGPVRPGQPATNGVVVKPHHGLVRRVKVTLDRVQVLDDKDGLFTGPGELAFSAIVAPNANPHRAVRTRIPDKGIVKLTSGQTFDVNEVIYEGLVEPEASLSITLGGTEFDYLLFFKRKEKLARYHRTLPLKSARMQPGDEPNDPESLRDWRVWYTLEVE